MRIKLRAAHAAAWLLGGATLAVAGRASADACPTTSNTVFISGSSAFVPVLQALTGVLGTGINIVSQKPGSCEGLDPVLESTPDTHAATLLNNNTAVACTLPAGGALVDIGVSDVYPSTCQATFDTNLPAVGAGFKDFLGPVQAMTFAVPVNSSENLISAEAAFMVFGFDANTTANSILPWTTPGDIYVRFWDSGTLEMIGSAIGLPGGKWKNATATAQPDAGVPAQQQSSGGNMASALVSSGAMTGHTNSTIGILSTSGLTASLKPLAFQGKNQTCSYLPDSTSSTTDKINVRQGRYDIWGPEHMITNVDGSGKPVGVNNNTAAVQTVINALLASSQAQTAQSDAGTSLSETEVGSLIAAFSKPSVGFIPWCAMQVQRSGEVGAESSYAPPAACSCAFEIANGAALSGHACTACTAQTESTVCTGSTPKCHFGYCEAE